MTFVCIDDGVPDETVGLLQRACADRDVPFRTIEASGFDYDVSERCEPGDLLYRPAVSLRACQVELFVHGPGVATFYGDDPFFIGTNQTLLFERAGLPIPRTRSLPPVSRDEIRDTIDRLGGLPVILKVGGYEGGVGVVLLDSWRSACSTLDYVWATGVVPLLSAYVPDAVHWRVVVVGDRAVAAYENHLREDDFRSEASSEADDYTDGPAEDLAEIALGAARALRRELVGVDILEHPSGRLYLLEANFPCYYPQAQLVAGIDIAGAMVDHLLSKATTLS
jgi:hypothetical protein